MIKERFMVSGTSQPSVTAYRGYLFINKNKTLIFDGSVWRENISIHTVKPLAVKVIEKKAEPLNEYRCPNCNVLFHMAVKHLGELYGTTPYCSECGQRLDWN